MNTAKTRNLSAIKSLRAMNAEFSELTGHAAFLYPTAPTGTDSWRYVFADATAAGPVAALHHMGELLTAAHEGDTGRLWWF